MSTPLREIRETIKILSRQEKFQLIQFLVKELATEEEELSQFFKPGHSHGVWSQYHAFEAAQSLQTLLDMEATK